jgi:NADPH:quinone reductase-like Zn-dependent oxidoreductase
MMKAAVCERYGPPEVVEISEVPQPVPGDSEVLVKAFATTVNSGDARVRTALSRNGDRSLATDPIAANPSPFWGGER